MYDYLKKQLLNTTNIKVQVELTIVEGERLLQLVSDNERAKILVHLTVEI